MTNEKQKEMIKKILETTIDDTPSKSLDGYLEVAVEYLNESIHSTNCCSSLRSYERNCHERIE